MAGLKPPVVDWHKKIPVLKELFETDLVDRNPALSVILAARDEERSVNESAVSILAQDYSGMLEVIAVNDRSTDRTGEILAELVTRYPDSLRVSNVGSLPGGWGKPTPCTPGPPGPQENGSCSPTQM